MIKKIKVVSYLFTDFSRRLSSSVTDLMDTIEVVSSLLFSATGKDRGTRDVNDCRQQIVFLDVHCSRANRNDRYHAPLTIDKLRMKVYCKALQGKKKQLNFPLLST